MKLVNNVVYDAEEYGFDQSSSEDEDDKKQNNIDNQNHQKKDINIQSKNTKQDSEYILDEHSNYHNIFRSR